MNSIAVEPANPQAPAPAELSPASRSVLDRVKAGDKTVTVGEASRLLKERPGLIAESLTMGQATVHALMSRMFGDDAYRREVMEGRVWLMRDELAGPDPTPVEKAVAERAAICWMEVGYLELTVAASGKSDRLMVRRVESANRRFLAAVKTLARVRKLALPDLKVTFDGRAVYIDGRRFGVTPDVEAGEIRDVVIPGR